MWFNKPGFVIHKANHKKGRSRHDFDIYKKNHPAPSKEVVNVFDLEYLGLEKDFLEQRSSLQYRQKRKQEIYI
ncbi:MAG: hypothetical protein ABJB76_11495 [Candidatus Nitrosocosmicus sp.]